MPVIQRGNNVRLKHFLHVLANKCLSVSPKVPKEGFVWCAQEFVQFFVDELTHERRFAILNKRLHIFLKPLAEPVQL